jgi:hypothetical protein
MAARACSGQTAGEGLIPQVRGVHPSDTEKARNAAWNRVTESAVETAVRDALKGAISVGE